MRRHPLQRGRTRWAALAVALAGLASLLATTGAQAVVVNDHATPAGVAMVQGTRFGSLAQPVNVLGAGGVAAPPSSAPTTEQANVTGDAPLRARMQLLPQGLHAVLRSGISVAVDSTGPANGIVSVYVSRAMAKRAHIKVGRGSIVVIGRGTLSQIKDGEVLLHLHLARSVAAKLKRVKHTTLNVRLGLVGLGGDRVTLVAAGNY